MYVETGLLGNSPITLTVVTSGTGFSRQWRIKVTQLSCDSPSKGNEIKLFKRGDLKKSVFILKLQIVVYNTIRGCRAQYDLSTMMVRRVVNSPIKIIPSASALKVISATSLIRSAVVGFTQSLVQLEAQPLLQEHLSVHWYITLRRVKSAWR